METSHGTKTSDDTEHARMLERKKRKESVGQSPTREQIRLMSLTHKGKYIPKDVKNQIAKSKKGRTSKGEPVCLLNTNFTIVGEYLNCHQLSEKLKIGWMRVQEARRGKRCMMKTYYVMTMDDYRKHKHNLLKYFCG